MHWLLVKALLAVMKVDRPDISKYCVVEPNGSGAGIAGLVEEPDTNDAPSNVAFIGRYVLRPIPLKPCGVSARDQMGSFNRQMQSTFMRSRVLS
tara:strand:- start:253 stop:534 length:282 start_codon:yes stop_codon:yes gene_type:complete